MPHAEIRPEALPAPSTVAADKRDSAEPGAQSSRLRRAARVAAIGAAGGALLLLDVPVCLFALVTRHPCPACGLTRATLALARGDLATAFAFHPLVAIVSPLVVGVAVYAAVVYVVQGELAAGRVLRERWVTVAAIVLGASTVLVWALRFLGAFGGPVPV